MFLNLRLKSKLEGHATKVKARTLTAEELRFKKERRKPQLSGRWHKIPLRPGRTEFRHDDLVVFKPDDLKAKVVGLVRTRRKKIWLYEVQATTGADFHTYGSDLLLVRRHKPKLEFPEKEKQAPKAPFPTKPKLDERWFAPKQVKVPRWKYKAIRKDKRIVARMAWWSGNWAWHPDEPGEGYPWALSDYVLPPGKNLKERMSKLGDVAKQIEADYWQIVEDHQRKRWGLTPDLVTIEWFIIPKEKKHEAPQSDRKVSPRQTPNRRSGRERRGVPVVAVPRPQGKGPQRMGRKRAAKRRGNHSGKKDRNVPVRGNARPRVPSRKTAPRAVRTMRQSARVRVHRKEVKRAQGQVHTRRRRSVRRKH